MKIGVISDTHGYFDPRIPALFVGVEHILHAGDIGPSEIIHQLEAIAPVTAVLGNNDFSSEFRETEICELGGFRFLIHHIVNPHSLPTDLRQRIERLQPHSVVFGHTHQPFAQRIDGVFYFNPGYAGKPRFHLARSVAVLRCEGAKIRHEMLPL